MSWPRCRARSAASIAELRDDSALVRFNFLAKVDVRSFRDDGGYVLDIVGADNKPDEQSAGTRRADRSAAKCGAGNHRARNGPARGGERRCRAPRRGGSAGSDGKTRHRATGNNRRA